MTVFVLLLHKPHKTPRGRKFTGHAAEQANKRNFTKKKVDDIIDGNYKNRKSKVDSNGRKTWEYKDKRTNRVVMNTNNEIVTVYSAGTNGNYIEKQTSR